jgi:hypothetical protein
MVDNKKQFSKLLNQKGQALFEMILFLPFMIFLVTIYYTCGNSINGSINQQKATRGYFYMLVRNNAFLNSQSDLVELSSKGLKTIGFSAIGWRDHGVEQEAFAPCFKFSSILNNSSSEDCDGKSPDAAEGSSRFVRVYTYYGVCGASFTASTTGGIPFILRPDAQGLANNCFNEN